MRTIRTLSVGALAVSLAVVFAGCGGGRPAGPAPVVDGSSAGTAPRPGTTQPPVSDGHSGPPPTADGTIFNVTVQTVAGEVHIEKLEVEFNRRRGIHAFYGFYRGQYETLEQIQFSHLARIDFLGPMPIQMFEQAMVGREQMELSPSTAFQVRLTYRDMRQEEFYAIIPRLRGWRDFQEWTYTLDNRQMEGVQYIDFR